MEHRNRLAVGIVVMVVLAASVAFLIYWKLNVVVPPTTMPPIGIPPAQTAETTERYAAFNLYAAGTSDSENIDRIELTLLKATLRRADGKEFLVKEGPAAVNLQENSLVKVYSELIPPGRHEKLLLEFSPSGRIVAKDGSVLGAFLPEKNVELDIGADLPVSRTLTTVMVLSVDAVGTRNNAPIFTLPKTAQGDSAILGGIFKNERSVGNVWTIAEPTIAAAVMADYHLDITKDQVPGSEGFVPATRGP